jgi:hypothetical protein
MFLQTKQEASSSNSNQFNTNQFNQYFNINTNTTTMNNIINNNINSSIMSFFDMIANHPAQPLVLDAIFVVIGIIIVMSILDDLIPFAFDLYEYVIEPRVRLMWNSNNNNSNSNSRGNRNSSRNSNSIIIRNNNSLRRASEEEPMSSRASTGRVVSNNNVEEDTSYYYLPPQLLLQTINSGVDNMPPRRRRGRRSAQSEGVVATDQGLPPVYPRRRRRTSNRKITTTTTTTNNDTNTNVDRIMEEEDASTPTLPVLSEEGLAPPVDTSTVASLFSEFASHGGEDEGDENSNNTNTGAEEEVGDVNNTTASFSFALPSDFGTCLSNRGGSGVGNEDASLTYSESNGDGELDFDLDTLDDNTNLSSTQQPDEPADIDILANEDSDEVDMDGEPIPEESNELFGVPLAPAQEEEVVDAVEELPQEQLLSEVEAVDDGTAEMELFAAAGGCNHVEAVAEAEEEEVLEEVAQVDEGGEEATTTVLLGSIWVKHPKYACMVRRSSRVMLMFVM